ncbi:MAG: hypothetical protein A3F67_08015 [Verrucomicrobia bacterium RIFCSPHIGHO2_12_FULL_41_10]|nr:MAG: hypothetical protein A3F67_08015 [Verrucomicrobia bacterium RIFCSPHIGHO2_12_FULL_41_10]
MIKIEVMSDDCIATINSTEVIFVGQLLTVTEFDTLVLTKGSVTYSVDEKEVLTRVAKTDSAKTPGISEAVEVAKTDSAKTPEISETVEVAKTDSAKTPEISSSVQETHSAKTPTPKKK